MSNVLNSYSKYIYLNIQTQTKLHLHESVQYRIESFISIY